MITSWMREDWRGYLQVLADHGPNHPDRVAYLAGLRGGGRRRDQVVRAAMQAMERRGWTKRSAWVGLSESWSITDEGRKQLEATAK
jgi:repressor of nif and glnA expression